MLITTTRLILIPLISLITLGLSSGLSPAVAREAAPLKTVERVDLKRYAGKWHQIALLPNRFQAQCLSDTTATYTLQADGKIEVKNRCVIEGGKTEEVIGAVKPLSGDTTGAKLKVRFAPAWLAWFPQVWGNYWVIDLDPDYQYAAVSEPDRKFLWILSRTPTMDAAKYSALMARLTAMGFDTTKLVVASPTLSK